MQVHAQKYNTEFDFFSNFLNSGCELNHSVNFNSEYIISKWINKHKIIIIIDGTQNIDTIKYRLILAIFSTNLSFRLLLIIKQCKLQISLSWVWASNFEVKRFHKLFSTFLLHKLCTTNIMKSDAGLRWPISFLPGRSFFHEVCSLVRSPLRNPCKLSCNKRLSLRSNHYTNFSFLPCFRF